MKNTILFVMVLAVALFAADAYRIETEVLSFANETAAKTDTLISGDSAFCTINQSGDKGIMPEKISLFLPGVLASGDSAKVYIQELSNARDGKIVYMQESYTSRTKKYSGYRKPALQNNRAASSTGTDVYKSYTLGNYYKGLGPATKGATVFTWSPKDSILGNRINIVLRETAGAPVITGMDSLKTSDIYIQRLFVQ